MNILNFFFKIFAQVKVIISRNFRYNMLYKYMTIRDFVLNKIDFFLKTCEKVYQKLKHHIQSSYFC